MLIKNCRLVFALLVLVACTPKASADPNKPVVVFETSHGTIEATLFADKAPETVKNILSYVDEGFYTGVVFHRVIKGFMIQGGGFSGDYKKKQPKPPIKNEAANGLKNIRGTLAMARTSNPDSATSQFFVNVKDNTSLDHKNDTPRGMGYCVFGEVTQGMSVVEAIENVDTCPKAGPKCTAATPPGMRDVPAEPVTITKAFRKK